MSSPAHSINPVQVLRTFRRNGGLIRQMARREVVGRYRGSVFGLLWSFIHPIFMLAIYTFVFSVVFRAKWGQTHSESRTEFAIILFAGLIVYNLFAEVLNRAPSIILSNANYVKRVVFPLEILPVTAICSALFHCMVSVLVLLAFNLVLNGIFSMTFFLLPVVLLPLLVLTLGIAWFLASLGVFLRDVGQVVGILTAALLFMSPIFFPAAALPEQIRGWLFLNPLTFIIEQARQVLIWGGMPHWGGLALYLFLSLWVCWGGLAWFQKTRKGFADVL